MYGLVAKLWPVLVHLRVIVYQLAVQCKPRRCYESQSRQLKNEGSLTTAFGCRRTTTKLFPTCLHVMYTPSIFLDPSLRGAMCGHGSIVRGIASTYCSGPQQSGRLLFSPSSTQTLTRITSLLRFLINDDYCFFVVSLKACCKELK